MKVSEGTDNSILQIGLVLDFGIWIGHAEIHTVSSLLLSLTFYKMHFHSIYNFQRSKPCILPTSAYKLEMVLVYKAGNCERRDPHP